MSGTYCCWDLNELKMFQVFWCTVVSSWYFGVGAPYLEVFSTAQGAAVKIFSVIDGKPTINLSKDAGRSLKKVEGNISFSNVHFEYPSRPGIQVNFTSSC